MATTSSTSAASGRYPIASGSSSSSTSLQAMLLDETLGGELAKELAELPLELQMRITQLAVASRSPSPADADGNTTLPSYDASTLRAISLTSSRLRLCVRPSPSSSSSLRGQRLGDP